MQKGDELGSFMLSEKSLDTTNRRLRTHLFHSNARTDDILLPQIMAVMSKEARKGINV